MADSAARIAPSEEALAMGQAIARIREAMGVSQEELAERLGVARQTISRYETGRAAVLRIDLQRQIAEALGVDIGTLVSESDNIVHPPFPRHALPAAQTVVAVDVPGMGEDGQVHYLDRPATSEDLGWLFGKDAGFLRLADGALPEGAVHASVAGYDRSAWPRRGQGCVIETRDGELLPRIYDRRTAAGVLVKGGEGDQTIPSNKIKGVYAIRFWGD